jgi:hypothetical protein
MPFSSGIMGLEINMASPSENAIKAFETLTHYLKSKGWSVQEMDVEFALVSEQQGEFYHTKYYFQIFPEHEQFLFYIAPQINLFEHMLPAAAEYICRANYGMRIGNFDLSFRDGQVSFRSGVNFRGTLLSEALIDGVMEPALQAFDEFFPGLKEVIAEIATPLEAIRKMKYGE